MVRTGGRRCGRTQLGQANWMAAKTPSVAAMAGTVRRMTIPAVTPRAKGECGERRIRASSRIGTRDHLPDGELHWPDEAPLPWAGQCWAIEAKLTRGTAVRTAEIMRELLTRTGDYDCPAAQAAEPSRPPRHARALYLCSPGALPAVVQARAEVGPLGARIEIRNLPTGASLPLPAGPSRAVRISPCLRGRSGPSRSPSR